MTHTFDSGGFFTFLVALAHNASPPACPHCAARQSGLLNCQKIFC